MFTARMVPVALLGLLGASAPAGAAEAETPLPVDAPLSLRGTRGAPDPACTNNVPLWLHEVQRGEHLGLIAGRYGVRRSDLVKLNADLKNPNHIVPGQKVKVCPEIAPRVRRQVVHKVGKGDTLSEIAGSHGLTVKELMAELKGSVKNPNHVVVGTELKFWVDGGVPEAFLPPLPKKKRSTSGSKGRKHARVNVQLQPSEHLKIKRPYLAYGTAKTIGLLGRVFSRYKSRHAKSPKILIGDISRRGGGKLHPHLSHKTGRDIDMGYVLTGAAAAKTRFSGVNRSNFDTKRTWTLVKSFLDTDEVVYIFMDYGHQKVLYDYAKSRGVSDETLDELFQYPRGRGRNHGIIRHWRSHKNHFHVRFKR